LGSAFTVPRVVGLDEGSANDLITIDDSGLSESRAGGADEFAQGGNIGAVGADTAGVHWQAEHFGLLDA
jgi:hypothetical protein